MFSCFYVFSLGTALLYRTAMRAATMYAQNGGKAFAQAPAAVSSLRKAGMKNLHSDFTNRINMPKMPFSGWAKRQKAPGTLSKNARGKRVCGSNRGKGRQSLGGCIAAILLDKEQRLADAVDDDLQHRRLTIPVSFLDFCIGEVQSQIFFLCGKGLAQQRKKI